MKLPRSMSAALKLGYRSDGFEHETYSHDERRITGDYKLLKDGAVALSVPFVATLKFGRPRRFRLRLRRRA